MKAQITITLQDDGSFNLQTRGPEDAPILFAGLLEYGKEMLFRKDRQPKPLVEIAQATLSDRVRLPSLPS